MTERACPRCHLQIPRDLLKRPPTFISVVGAAKSGKSHFLTSMVYQLRRDLPSAFGYVWTESDSHDVKAFLEYERALFGSGDTLAFVKKTEEEGELYNKPRIDGVDVKLPKPFIFSVRACDPLRSNKCGEIILYDNAGESFEYLREQEGDCVTQHMQHASAVLFALDPLQDHRVRQRLSTVSGDPQLTTAAYDCSQEQILNETINRIRRHRNLYDRPLPVILLVCVQKYDVWRPLLASAIPVDGYDQTDPIDHTSVEIDPATRFGRLDVDEINRISLLVRSFIADISPQFVAEAEANFAKVRYFPVSALGTSPEYDPDSSSKLLKVRSANLRPFRVTHPLLWLLNRGGVIPRVPPDAGTGYPVATVLTAEEKLRVQLPGSKLILTLDRQYAGMWVIDPQTGDRVTIPAVEIKARPKPPPLPIDNHTLKLPDPPSPPKRGWFTKK